ncbi:ABC transporter substrate-binding protein [Acetobacter sp. TBRC 12305]|uniref:ABC transporter substrate-binding protein n=1 Tax=Acetobacter garciniae TaxID=2817435 RepID=A0A939HN05_9PROT|nr:ABC transporter substrate-binding protein [Acetobacter garciniae]MBO1323926.1 ABC transporter substrate-binding protein [Acetobacter garciniae]MBX0343615.1 ABC transporter substrate-binding protein [Acetobacter garciniae]
MRRLFLKLLVGVSLFAAGVSGRAEANETVRVGYIPVLGSSALFVLDGMGWAKQAGLDVQLVRFTSGPQAIQALVSGRIDAYVAGVLPLLQARAHGVDVKVVAVGSVEELSVVARGALAAAAQQVGQQAGSAGGLSAQGMKDALGQFSKTQGHVAKLAAQPPGSVPDTLARYWLKKQLGVADINSVASIVGLDIDAAQQAFLAGAVDAAVLREPAVTVVTARVPGARIFATGHDMMPDQPGSVLAIVRPNTPDHQAWAKTLTALFVRATTLLAQKPDDAAPYVQKALGGGLLSDDIMKKALERSAPDFVSDPARIEGSVKELQAFEVAQGLLRQEQPVEDLFDLTLWRQAQQ